MALNLHLLRLFATVARAGSFSKAAEILLLSQPSISKGVRDFELQLGCRLLDRTPRGVKPTREGLALMRHAETLFAAERDAEEELRALRSLDSGSLRIGASTTIATYFIPKYLGRFHAAYPGIDLQLTSANTRDIAHLMLAHEIEIGLVEGPVEEDGLVSEPWRTDVMELIVGPDHPFAREHEPIDPRRIAGETLIVREQGSGSREVIAQARRPQNRSRPHARDGQHGGDQASGRGRAWGRDRVSGGDAGSDRAQAAARDQDARASHRANAVEIENAGTARRPLRDRVRTVDIAASRAE
jgi:DNA-binding transcriptional LysR family regulator